MPKASKKKGAKEADFKKAKVKLGKGKQQASNATNTSFKARSIALPNQTPIDRVLQGPSGEPITSNGLTLEEVLFRFRHPNSGVRRDAIGAAKEILVQQPSKEVGKVCRVMGGAISDEDASVRKALIGFFGWYLITLPTSILTPHLPLLQLQTSSALSHIFPEIRLDAARLVHLFLEQIPTHITSSWPAADSTIMEGLRLTVGLGNDKGVSTQGGRLGAQAKLVTLRTILAFIRTALHDSAGRGVDEMFTSQFRREIKGKGKGKARVVGEDGLEEQYEGSLVGCGEWGLEEALTNWELGRLEATSSLSGKEVEIETLTQLYNQLHPLLLATFLEAAPSAFSPSSSTFSTSDETSLELCTVSAALTEILSRSILSHDSEIADIRTVRSNASDFLKRMAAWFPFHNPATATSSSTGVSPAFELSLTYSKLAILLAPRPKVLAFPRGKKEVGWKLRIRATEESWKEMRMTGKSKGKGKADGWALEEVSEWIISVLAPQDALTPSMTPTAYSSILSLILPLLLLPPTSEIPTTIGQALLSHLSRQGSSSQIKSLGNQFLISLVLAHEVRFPSIPFFITPQSPLRADLTQWIENLPKTLWEIGTKDPLATQKILEFLLNIGQRGKGAFEEGFSLVEKKVFGVVAARLGPWFWLEHPSKGGIKGPWTKLERDVKKLGLDVASIWTEYDVDKSLQGAVGKAVESDDWARSYWASRSS